jgi:hypothetical protein
LRCYAPSTSAIAALLFIGYLALGHSAGHTVASLGPIVIGIVVLGVLLLAGGIIVVTAAMVRGRRAAAGACHTCRHPCREEPDLGTPLWPDRPLTRAPLPVVVIPGQRAADGERVSAVRAGTADH